MSAWREVELRTRLLRGSVAAMRVPVLPVLSAVLAAVVACGTSSGSGTGASSAPILPADDASDGAAWQSPPGSADARCRTLATYTDCHLCCMRPHPKASQVPWEAFRTCACKKTAPRVCAAECGEAYCGEAYPFRSSTLACRQCLSRTFDGDNADCILPAGAACDADGDCSAAASCNDRCPAMTPQEDEDVIEQRLIDEAP